MYKFLSPLLAWILLFCFLLFPPSPHASETIKVAAIFARTGEAATPSARMMFESLRFALVEINKKGGLFGRDIELIEIDSKSTALGSKAAAEQAVKEGVVAVIGGSRSSQALAMAPVLQDAHIPMISPSATIPELTAIGDYIFRVCFVDDFQGKIMATFAIRDMNAATAVVLTNTGNKYSLGLARVFSEQYRKAGGEILMEGEYLEDVTDFPVLLKKVSELNPQVVFLPGYARDTGRIMTTAKELGVNLRFIGGDGWTEELLYKYAGDAAEGSFTCSSWNKSNSDAVSQWFVTEFEKIYGTIYNYTVPLTYDALMLLADAIVRANSFDPPKIRDALAATKSFKGVSGRIIFDENRNPIDKPAVILKYEKGATVYYKTFNP